MKKWILCAALVFAGPVLAQSLVIGRGNWSNIAMLAQPNSLTLSRDAMSRVDKLVEDGKCPAIKKGGGINMNLRFITKLDTAGKAERIVVESVDCPDVESIAASTLLAYSNRGFLKAGNAGKAGWYRGEIVYTLE